jgi:uncharacterized Zn-binding protein involved in type VI secretion
MLRRMKHRTVRLANALATGLILCAACSSTSSSTSLGDGGSGDGAGNPSVPARVVLRSQFGPGTEAGVNDASKCQVMTQDWATIGDDTHPVDDGQSAGGSIVSASCTVKPDGDGFAVDGSVSLAGQGGIVLRGHFTATGAQTKIYAAFTRGLVGNFQASDCTADYTANAEMGVAAGRLWTTLTCPHLFAAQDARTCLGTAEIRLENCLEK